MSDETPIRYEYELLEHLLALELQVIESKKTEFQGTVHMKMLLREEPDLLATCSFALIYGIGVMSFADARPRGVSGMHFEERDDWYVADMLRHLEYERGELHFYADYVRGRMMKTTVDIHPDGTIRLETINRGESAARWVATLQGKKRLSVVGASRDGGGAG
jgi:hypothetical protein